MTVWKSYGASVIGPGHLATGRPNQDAWAAFHCDWGDGIVVSDGLGSKQYSDYGSHAACLAVARAAHACRGKNVIDCDSLLSRIKSRWLSLIAPLESCDCAATCLFAFRMNDGVVRMGMLGDGLAAVLKPDGSVVLLTDDKSEGFSNITTALSTDVSEKDWRRFSIPEGGCKAIVLCSDGVADDLKDPDGFVMEFVSAHRTLSSVSASRCVRDMLDHWPTPKHSDDKTIACLFREEVANE